MAELQSSIEQAIVVQALSFAESVHVALQGYAHAQSVSDAIHDLAIIT